MFSLVKNTAKSCFRYNHTPAPPSYSRAVDDSGDSSVVFKDSSSHVLPNNEMHQDFGKSVPRYFGGVAAQWRGDSSLHVKQGASYYGPMVFGSEISSCAQKSVKFVEAVETSTWEEEEEEEEEEDSFSALEEETEIVHVSKTVHSFTAHR